MFQLQSYVGKGMHCKMSRKHISLSETVSYSGTKEHIDLKRES